MDVSLLYQCFSLSLPLSFPLSLEAMKKISLDEDFKKIDEICFLNNGLKKELLFLCFYMMR